MRSQGRFFPCCVRASMTANSCRCLRCAALFRPVSRGMPRWRDLILTLSGRQRSGCRRFASFVQTSEGVLPKGSGWQLRTSRSSGSESSATIRSAGGGCRVSASGRPCFGFFGLGYGLYCVGQATRRKNASVIAAPPQSHHRRVWRPAGDPAQSRCHVEFRRGRLGNGGIRCLCIAPASRARRYE
jgi:hypothetical protein